MRGKDLFGGIFREGDCKTYINDKLQAPMIVRIKLRRAALGLGVDIFVSKTGIGLCPVSAILNYLAVRPGTEGPLLVHGDGSPIARDQFVRGIQPVYQGAPRITGGCAPLDCALSVLPDNQAAKIVHIVSCIETVDNGQIINGL